FSDQVVKVDESVANAARLIRLPGTTNSKGDSTAEQPHRLARVLSAPAPLAQITLDQVRALAALLPPAPEPPRSARLGAVWRTFDIEEFIRIHNLAISREGPWANGGCRWVLAECPFQPNHQRKAYIVRLGSGAVSAGCQHDSCKWTWRDL